MDVYPQVQSVHRIASFVNSVHNVAFYPATPGEAVGRSEAVERNFSTLD